MRANRSSNDGINFFVRSFVFKTSMSFGDESNDLSMLRAAGRGVAMGNASKDVKAAADAVCETNTESGVAKEIRRVLGKE